MDLNEREIASKTLFKIIIRPVRLLVKSLAYITEVIGDDFFKSRHKILR